MNVGTTTAAAMIHGLMGAFAVVEACATVRDPEVVAETWNGELMTAPTSLRQLAGQSMKRESEPGPKGILLGEVPREASLQHWQDASGAPSD